MKYAFPVLAAAFPFIVGAADGINNVLDRVADIIAQLVPIVIALALLTFLWGVLQYVIAKDPESQKDARGVMLYGIIALFVMVSVWGLVQILGDTFGLDGSVKPPIPAVPQP